MPVTYIQMIPRASQRGYGQQLATHLMNAEQNEDIQIHDVRGAIVTDLHGAFQEWEAVASGTMCKKYLYSLSINPDQKQAPLNRDQYMEFIHLTEQELGLKDQPRAIVFHIKEGREHCHVVWSRINCDTMKSVHISHDRYKLRAVTQEFATLHNLELPEGMKKDNGTDRFQNKHKSSTMPEKYQQERTGISKEERMKDVTAAWNQSDTAPAFISALRQRGYILARGDKKAYVVVDRYGEVHSLPRQIEGVRKKDIDAKLRACPREDLPSATQGKELAREQNKLTLKDHFSLQADQRRLALKLKQNKRRAPLDDEKTALTLRQREERKQLIEIYRQERKKIIAAKKRNRPKGLAAFLGRITGITALFTRRFRAQDTKKATLHHRQLKQLEALHAAEYQTLNRKHRTLNHIERRELRSLETRLRREIYTARRTCKRQNTEKETLAKAPKANPQIHLTGKEITTRKRRRLKSSLTQPPLQEKPTKTDTFRTTADEITQPSTRKRKTKISDSMAKRPKQRAHQARRIPAKEKDEGKDT